MATLTRIVNGEIVPLTQAEEAEVLAERSAWAATKAARASAPPASVPNFKLRIAIRRAGLQAAVENYVSTLDQESKDAWEYSTDISIDSPYVVAACAALGLSNAQKAAIFKAAARL
jgi:hypothetical protein